MTARKALMPRCPAAWLYADPRMARGRGVDVGHHCNLDTGHDGDHRCVCGESTGEAEDDR